MTGTRCAWPGCARGCRADRLMCRQHWLSLPRALRSAIWAHYTPGQNALTCFPEYREALRDVLGYARQVNAEAERQAEQEAAMRRRQGVLW